MTSFVAVFAIAFAAILLVELPDKTMVATLVLSTRYRRRPVLAGAVAAFAVQCVVAVTAGGLLHLLPHRILEATVALLFAVGAVLLFRESVSTEDDQLETPVEAGLSDRRIFGISFGVLFAAEWGDASQLATAGLVARYGQPVATGLGAFLALVSVAALAVLIGKAILRRVPLELVHRVAAVAFAVFAVIAGVAAIRG
ncbi:MAG TPA: TMEM165/GDT1 family protein [Jatrophihabitans sp.]|jgi:putative Ca2+/H+ antiporter (TMEM165/GDT1 family)|uniref:TMEM165/GDT1 family protein n=1 Tax=Jatrophihabitans sp. TaxID=1932789 RepID=UPI002EE3C967